MSTSMRDPRREPAASDVWQDASFGKVEILSVEKGAEWGIRVTTELGRYPGIRNWDFQAFVKLLSHAKLVHAADPK